MELGFANGTSSCYMAAALHEKGKGKVVTIDNLTAKDRTPNIDELMELTELSEYIEPIYANKSYNWELMKLIEKQTKNGLRLLITFIKIDSVEKALHTLKQI